MSTYRRSRGVGSRRRGRIFEAAVSGLHSRPTRCLLLDSRQPSLPRRVRHARRGRVGVFPYRGRQVRGEPRVLSPWHLLRAGGTRRRFDADGCLRSGTLVARSSARTLWSYLRRSGGRLLRAPRERGHRHRRRVPGRHDEAGEAELDRDLHRRRTWLCRRRGTGGRDLRTLPADVHDGDALADPPVRTRLVRLSQLGARPCPRPGTAGDLSGKSWNIEGSLIRQTLHALGSRALAD
jgi:hypothetical protein